MSDEDVRANKAAFDDTVTFLYNSQHTDLGFPKEKAIRVAAYCERLQADLDAANERARVLEAERAYWRRLACNRCGDTWDCLSCATDAALAAREAVKEEQAMPCHDVSTSQGTPCVNEDDHE